MGRRTLIGLALGVAAAIASASSCSGDSQSCPPVSRPDAGPACGPAQRNAQCDAGQACVNSVCVQTCPTGSECPAGTYCEGDAGFEQVCAPVQATFCKSEVCSPNKDCPPPQGCNNNLCFSRVLLADGGTTACDFTKLPDGGLDGCGPDAVCYATTQTTNNCVALPACSQDGTCPIGPFGSVCNTRPDGGKIIAGKQRLCLSSYCDSRKDCPTSRSHCVRDPIDIAGACWAGVYADPCASNADCITDGGCQGAGADAGLGVCR